MTRRSHHFGLLVRYEVESDEAPNHVEFDPLEDGEPPQEVDFPVRPGTDARYFHGFAFKPTINGDFTMSVRAYRRGSLIASASCPITVIP